MDLFDFQGQAFRARLRGELARWREDGLIDERTSERIARRYDTEESGAKTTAAAVYILGVMLIGGGVISLVAWNWHALSTGARLAMTVGATAVAQWFAHRFLARGRRGIGDALLLLGTLLFGAALFVVARHFRQGIDWPVSLLLWTLGGAASAWIYAGVPTAIFALCVSVAWVGSETSSAPWWIPLMPLAQLALFGPLAWRARSGPLLFAGAVAVGITVGIAAVPEGRNAGAVVSAVLAWSLLLLSASVARPRESALSRTATGAGMLLAGLPIYFASFHEPGAALSLWNRDGHLPLLWLWTAVPCLILAVMLALQSRGRPIERPASLVAAFGVLLVMASLWLPNNAYAVPIAANLALAGTAAAGIASSVQRLRRGPFWLGTMMLGILIVTRFFEYQSNLLLKALAFILCGALAIWGGNAFERRIGRERATGTDAEMPR